MKTPPRILVVDDTPQNVLLLSDLLASQGYAVTTAASGAEALAQMQAEPVDLVLLDVVMPEMSGYEVCRRIRQKPDTGILPVIMVTALDPPRSGSRAWKPARTTSSQSPSTSPSCWRACDHCSGSRSSTTRARI